MPKRFESQLGFTPRPNLATSHPRTLMSTREATTRNNSPELSVTLFEDADFNNSLRTPRRSRRLLNSNSSASP